MAANRIAAHITGVKTFGIPVRDQGRALDFYVGKLGLELRTDTLRGHERWIEVAPPGSTTTLALVRGPNQVRVGIDTQIQLTTDDAEAWHAHLVSVGVQVDGEVKRSPTPTFTIYDPDDNRVVIIEE
jgi:predicted enzyme related to lactoylglutathione lyase